MKNLLLLVIMICSAQAFSMGCDVYRINALEKLEFCFDDNVLEIAGEVYLGKGKDELSENDIHFLHTPNSEDVYGDNDGASTLSLNGENGKKFSVRYKMNYGCSIVSCTSTDEYLPEN